jgi:nitroimidazol reductase NimA-like FMN-containing flavoprotein (pyridoxamine 5'-phosphate oxidase superfamily)
MLAWTDVEKILRNGRYYWISTTDADGRPHLVQQWGAWVDDHLYFEGSERTHWAQNLARDARVAFGTQTGTRALFGQGTVEVVRGAAPAVAKKFASQNTSKYVRTFDNRPKPEQYEKGHVFRAKPSKIIAFDVKHFTASGTRFTF